MPPNIRIRGGKFNRIEGDYTVIDHSKHETHIDSNNVLYNKVTDAYNNSKKIGEQISTYSHSRSSEGDEIDRMSSTTTGMSIY